MGSRTLGGWSCTVTGGCWVGPPACVASIELYSVSRQCDPSAVHVDEWWPELSSTAYAWLTANDDGAISVDILRKFTGAGATVTSNTRWIRGDTSDGFYLSDRVTEWIEEISNKEHCQGSAYGDGCGHRLSRAPDSSRCCRE